MTTNIRGQILFRHACGYTRSSGDSFQAPESAVPYTYYIAMGLLEADDGALPDEKTIDFNVDRRNGGVSLSFGGDARQLPNRAAVYDLGDVLVDLDFKAPYLGALLICGGLALRKTRFPATEGRVAYALAGVVRSPVDILPTSEMFVLAGNHRRLVSVQQREIPDAFPEGSTLKDTFAKPIWGFEDEPRGLVSTKRLDCIDLTNEISRLEMLPTRTKEEQNRLDTLSHSWLAQTIKVRDERFEEFKRRLRGAGGYRPLDTYPTASESNAHHDRVREVVEQMMRRTDEVISPRM